MRHFLMLTVAVLLLTGCATGYQKDTLPMSMSTGGYSDERLQPDLFRITYDGVAGREEAVGYFTDVPPKSHCKTASGTSCL